jgi:Myb-like DNA-binding protein REB1
MDILRVKKAHFPPPPVQAAKKRKERKVMSAAAIPDVDVNSTDTTRAGSENTIGADVSRTSQATVVNSGSNSDGE